MALIDNIQAYWKFDEASGDAADSTANNNDLTNRNTTAYAAAKINNGADMEASSNNGFSITDAAQTGLDFSDALTFAGWIKLESNTPAAGYFSFVGKRVAAGNQRSYLFYGGASGGTLNLDWSSTGADGSGVSVSWSPSTATFYHIAVTKSGTTVKFYVDGSQQGTDQTGSFSGIFNSTAEVDIGWWVENTPDANMDGFMDEWGLWSRALSAAEISQLYNSGNGLTYPFASGPQGIASINGVASASIGSINGKDYADITSINGVS